MLSNRHKACRMTLLSLQQTHAVRHPDYHAKSYPDSPEYHTSRCSDPDAEQDI